ncbi:MAG: VCBS repeat-containing protein [Planctomycetota bacterium]
MRVGIRRLLQEAVALVTLLSLALVLSAGCTSGDTPPAVGTEDHRFLDVTEQTGITPQHLQEKAQDRFMPESMSGGVVLFDCDGDGDLDLYHIRHGLTSNRITASASAGNRLYRQDDSWHFTDVTETCGAADRGYGMGAAAGDIDNDGDLDLYIGNLGQDRLLRNDGGGVFTDITEASGIDVSGWSSSILFADIDADGHLDIYVCRYLDFDEQVRINDSAGRPEYPAPGMFRGALDQLLRNNGDGSFVNITMEAGLSRASRGLGVVATDLDADGNIDFYIANDGEPNQAWIGDGAGGFRDEALAMGLAVNIFGQPEAGMGIAHGDIDDDGLEDLIVTHLVSESDTLYRNLGDGNFEDATGSRGLAHTTLDFTGFGSALFDADGDGDLDLVTVHGRVLRGAEQPGATGDSYWKPYAEQDHLFINDGRGRFLIDANSGFSSRTAVSRGLSIGDIDDDGDLDVIIAEADGSLRFWKNQSDVALWWLLDVIDASTNRCDTGAVVEFHQGDAVHIRRAGGGGSYLSASDMRVYFSSTAEVTQLKVRWSDGERERFTVPAAGRVSTIRKGTGE